MLSSYVKLLHLTSFDSEMRALVAVKRVVDYAVKVALACWLTHSLVDKACFGCISSVFLTCFILSRGGGVCEFTSLIFLLSFKTPCKC